MPNLNWKDLSHLQTGKYAEYYVKMEFTSYGFDVFTSEVDDKGIDFVARNKNGKFFEIQVKSLREKGYVFARKDKFDVNNKRLIMAIVVFREGELPRVYLIPAIEWKKSNKKNSTALKNRDYINRKSKPEWGVEFSSQKKIDFLNKYLLGKTIDKLLNS